MARCFTGYTVTALPCSRFEMDQRVQAMGWEHEDSKVLMHPFTSTKDLATLCCDEWLELQTISAFMAIINNSTNRRKAMTFSNLVELKDNELESVMATELKNVDEIALILHVGKNTRNSYISSRNLPGNHWSFLTVDLQSGSFKYCDSMC